MKPFMTRKRAIELLISSARVKIKELEVATEILTEVESLLLDLSERMKKDDNTDVEELGRITIVLYNVQDWLHS